MVKKIKIEEYDNTPVIEESEHEQEIEIEKKVFRECDPCEYVACSASEWLQHCKTNKHKKGGIDKQTECLECDFKATTHWNYVIHFVSKHATPEQKKEKSKFYCDLCVVGFFCKPNYDSHLKSKKHTNLVTIAEMDKQEKKKKKQ
jgi:hypothetical protein